MAETPRTLFEKIWADHVIERLDERTDLIHIDRHVLHDLSGPFSMMTLENMGLACVHPELTFAVPDHGVSTAPDRLAESGGGGGPLIAPFRDSSAKLGIEMFDLDTDDQGIVHVIAPELGLALPGLTIVCGDSHTCTQGALGALAWGIGNTEVTQVLATQALVLDRPLTLRVHIEGRAQRWVGAKDVALALIARYGTDAASGSAVEFAGGTVAAMTIESRLTLCNLALEMGARFAFVAPDETTFSYVQGRRYAPTGRTWDDALAYWRTLESDAGAVFDHEIGIDVSKLAPQITWGTSPAHTIAIDEAVPDLDTATTPEARSVRQQALEYVGLEPGQRLEGTPIQHVFIGSCTNSRLSDLEEAARVVRGRTVAPGVRAWVVPGSRHVQREAARKGLDEIFKQAGFEWREPGCSMCIAMNGDSVPSGERCLSTSNRNFVGRQGPGSRTHLVSPVTAAAAALTGRITDPRALEPRAASYGIDAGR